MYQRNFVQNALQNELIFFSFFLPTTKETFAVGQTQKYFGGDKRSRCGASRTSQCAKRIEKLEHGRADSRHAHSIMCIKYRHAGKRFEASHNSAGLESNRATSIRSVVRLAPYQIPTLMQMHHFFSPAFPALQSRVFGIQSRK